MTHKPISLHNICLCFGKKVCFDDFNTQIQFGSRIAIIGRNGSGKSTMLKLLLSQQAASSGELNIPSDVIFSYVPQVIDQFTSLSGGQRFNKLLTSALASNPNVLLLDEPTNHLDARNRKNLLKKINDFYGTTIIVTHDIEVLRNCVDTIWHIDNGCITEFSGNYDDYMRESALKRHALEKRITELKREKNNMHTALMQEQSRAAKSKSKGQKSIAQKKWPTVVSNAKFSRAQQTSGKKKYAIDHKKNVLTEELSATRLAEIITPTFSLLPSDNVHSTLVTISSASIAYTEQDVLLQDINISVAAQERVAIIGDNGSGKSTIIKAILNDPNIIKTGEWIVPKRQDIGYLDQHYTNIAADKTVLELLSDQVPAWSEIQCRRHLNDFLFKSNADVNTLGRELSGGERARLSLAMIAARPPKLLILDEITNNLDMETTEHVAQILQAYPGAIIIVSHDFEFLRKIKVDITVLVDKSEHSLTTTHGVAK
jgi:ATPase subunit of ABC transporter with duplicated ATPase domains